MGAMSGGLLRGTMDVVLPIFLSSYHQASAKMIGGIFGIATCAYAIGSSLAGRLSDLSPSKIRLMSVVLGIVSALVVLPGTGHTLWVAAFFALFCGTSGFLGVNITTQIQKYANRIGRSEEAMGAASLLWTATFALGGLIANLASESIDYQRRVLPILGMACALTALGNKGIFAKTR